MLRRANFAATLSVLVLAGFVGDAGAEALPLFDLDICSWNATHVVVATEGTSIDGHVTVVESWVGPLAHGVELGLPELAVYAPVESRKLRGGGCVTGARMVLFLKHDAIAQTWTSASEWGHLGESACWIEDDAAYAHLQQTNTGGVFINPLGKTERAVRARVQHMRETKTALAEIRTTEDVTQRLVAAARYADADSSLVMNQAFDILEGCGKAAVPFLLSLSDEDPAGRYRYEVYRALGTIGDPSAVKPLVEKLEQELGFWQQAKAELDEGWWNGKSMGWRESKPYRRHVNRVYYPLAALEGIAAPGYEDVVRRTRELWLSTPALRDVEQGRIVKACDAALRALETKHPTK